MIEFVYWGMVVSASVAWVSFFVRVLLDFYKDVQHALEFKSFHDDLLAGLSYLCFLLCVGFFSFICFFGIGVKVLG